MVMTPFLLKNLKKIVDAVNTEPSNGDFMIHSSGIKDHIIVCGYGKLGQEIVYRLKKMNVNFETQLLLDPYGKGAQLFNVTKIPRTFVITPDGKIAKDFLIFKDGDYEDFKAEIQSLLKK